MSKKFVTFRCDERVYTAFKQWCIRNHFSVQDFFCACASGYLCGCIDNSLIYDCLDLYKEYDIEFYSGRKKP